MSTSKKRKAPADDAPTRKLRRRPNNGERERNLKLARANRERLELAMKDLYDYVIAHLDDMANQFGKSNKALVQRFFYTRLLETKKRSETAYNAYGALHAHVDRGGGESRPGFFLKANDADLSPERGDEVVLILDKSYYELEDDEAALLVEEFKWLKTQTGVPAGDLTCHQHSVMSRTAINNIVEAVSLYFLDHARILMYAGMWTQTDAQSRHCARSRARPVSPIRCPDCLHDVGTY